MAKWVVAMPFAALLIVAVAFAVVLSNANSGDDVKTTSRSDETPTGIASPTPAATRVATDVCKSLGQTANPGQSRVFASYYTQQREVLGIAIVGGSGVDPKAFDVAEDTIRDVFENNDLEGTLADAQAYVIIADEDEGVLDLPEFGCLEETVGSAFFTHVCGIADRADYPVATVNEQDLLGGETGPCGGINILYHELGHLVQIWALPPPDYFEVKFAYQDALNAGKYRGQYASRNWGEYWADGTQAYFLYLLSDGSQDREWLERYDPVLYKIFQRTYGD